MKKDISLSLFGDEIEEVTSTPKTKVLRLSEEKLDLIRQKKDEIQVEGIDRLSLPTRWEQLQPKIEGNDISLRTIISPVHDALEVVRDIIEYLQTTGGCQVLVIRADTGSGKTTFLNTMPHYMQDIEFNSCILDIQTLNEEEFGDILWKTEVKNNKINLIILEGREKPESITDKYIQIVLSHINRFSRSKKVPILFVIPTIEDQVARNWCEHGIKVGDLIPQNKLYSGSRWYNFPGLPKEKYVQIVEETVRVLNSPKTLVEFGVSADEIKKFVDVSPTIGRFIENIASTVADRRRTSRLRIKGRKEHIWIVYCSPDLRHYDHTYLVLDGLV